MRSADKTSPETLFSNLPFSRLPLLLLILIVAGGCTQTPKAETASASRENTSISAENYSRVLLEDELVGYVGYRKISVQVGGSKSESGIYQVYNTAFEILGTYDESGNTRIFRRDQPVLLGTFSPENSVKQITGLSGRVQILDGLQ